jgi:preprotein translocase subunit SecE
MSTVPIKAAGGGGDDEGGRRLTGWWDRSRSFFTEVRSEMRRVTWPARREVYATTVVVILTSAFFGLYLFGLDMVLGRAIEWVYRSFGAA